MAAPDAAIGCKRCGSTAADLNPRLGWLCGQCAYDSSLPAGARPSGSVEGERTTGASKPSIGTAKPTDHASSPAGKWFASLRPPGKPEEALNGQG